MAEFTTEQQAALEEYWFAQGGLAQLAEDFIQQMTFFMEHCPEIISDNNKKIEAVESRNYSAVAERCKKLLEALELIPEGERLNILSLRERRPEYDNKAMPICEPYVYVDTMRELAEHWSYELKRPAKHARQLYGLRNFVKRFPPLKSVNRKKFIELAQILWPSVNGSSFEKVYKEGTE